MASCSAIITFLFAYIITFIYVREPHYKYIGYIMLTIVYIFSVFATIQSRNLFIPSIVTNPTYAKGLAFALFIIVFVTLFSLIKILDAYSTQASKLKSFDLKLNRNYKTLLQTFENTFIIGNVVMSLLLILLSSNMVNAPLLYAGILIPFVCVWFQLSSSIQFSKIKND